MTSKAFGTFNLFYGHPPNTPLPELIEVPWFEVEAYHHKQLYAEAEKLYLSIDRLLTLRSS